MWLQCFLMHYYQQNRLQITSSASHSVVSSTCVLQVLHPVECVSFSLSLTASSSVAQRACVYAGLTRCWFNHWTDDRLSQQPRRQIHSPTLSRLLLRSFSACFVYIRLSVSFLLTPYQSDFFFSQLGNTRVDCLQTELHTLSVSSSCVWFLSYETKHCKIKNYDFKTKRISAVHVVKSYYVELRNCRSRE